jgi:UDP-N-acetylglucosamine 3-dehydrogenase
MVPVSSWMPRVHVVGAGAMGARHVRVFAAAGAQVTVEDSVPARALDVAARVPGVVAATLAESAKGEVHLVVVATPTITHERIARAVLAAGAHVLVEKPLASTLRAAETVAQHAAQSGRAVMVGMSERFHPVVRAVREQLAVRGGTIRALSCRRFGPGSATQPALLNLGVHDVDLAMHLSGASLVVHGARAHGPDGAQLLLGRSGAREASFTLVSGAAPVRERRLVVELTSGEILRGDLLTPKLVLERAGMDPETLALPTGEPLLLQAQAVMAALRDADAAVASAVASAEDGVRALRIVEDAHAAMVHARPVAGAVPPSRSSSGYLAAAAAAAGPAAEKL